MRATTKTSGFIPIEEEKKRPVSSAGPDGDEVSAELSPNEARSLQRLLSQALGHPDMRLYRLATDAISRARYCHRLFELGDLPRLRKAAQVGDTANRLYAAALLLALAGHSSLRDAEPEALAA